MSPPDDLRAVRELLERCALSMHGAQAALHQVANDLAVATGKLWLLARDQERGR